MASVPYDLSQGETLTVANPFLPATIGGDNPTPFYLHFPTLPPGMQWVFPYTYNFMYPIDPPHQINISAGDTPPGFPVAAASSAVALLHAYDVSMPYNAGTQGSALPSQQAKPVVNGIAFNGNTSTYPIGAGTVSLALMVTGNTPAQITVTGVQSGYVYYQFVNSDVPTNVPLWRSVIGDTSVTIAVVGNCTVTLYASPVPQVVTPQWDRENLDGTKKNLRVYENGSDQEIGFDSTIAAGAVLSVLAPLGGNSYVFRFMEVTVVTVSAGGFAELRGAPSSVRSALWPTDLAIAHRFGPVMQQPILNDGYEIHNAAAGAIRVSGSVHYRQQLAVP